MPGGRHSATRRAAFSADLSRLVLKLSDILRAAFSHSQAGPQPQSLKQSLGGPHQDAFDFDALVAHRRQGRAARRAARRRAASAGRARAGRAGVAALLRSADAGATMQAGVLRFRSSTTARPRRRPSASACPSWSALVKAISIAELEVDGRYVEAEHDLVFEAFGEHVADRRRPGALSRLPGVHPARAQRRAGERQPDGDAVERRCRSRCWCRPPTCSKRPRSAPGTSPSACAARGWRPRRWGWAACSCCSRRASNLFALRARVAHGLACRGPALFSVFAGAPHGAGPLPPYLSAAAAMQSRAFPAFSYDAAAGGNWADALLAGEQPAARGRLAGREPATMSTPHCSASASAAPSPSPTSCSATRATRRTSRCVPRERWSAAMLPAADWLALDEQRRGPARALPAGGRRRRRAAARDRRRAPDAGHAPLPAAVAPPAGTRRRPRLARRTAAGAREGRVGRRRRPTSDVARTRAPAAAEHRRGRRRRSRDIGRRRALARRGLDRHRALPELQRMPAHQRPHVRLRRAQAGLSSRTSTAGTYRQLVEAAESCQVAIIHPGKPRDPNEPGLDELLARAEPFR